MNKNEILTAIYELSKSQGFYGRLYENIVNAENKAEILDFLENQNFSDNLDMILFFES